MITHQSSLESFEEQFDFVLNNYSGHGYKLEQFDHIILGGLGGSGISASIAKAWFYDKCNIPIEQVNDYFLPSYASSKSLVVLNSYSGNTEETISMFEQAKAAGSTIITISSGGKLQELSADNSITSYSLPTGFQPRMTIGFGLSYLLLVIGDVLNLNYREKLEELKREFPIQRQKQIDSADQIFGFFKSSLKRKFVILADRQYAAVAIRFSQQLNENAKLEAFVNIIPEANHNVLESYVDRLDTNFIMLYSEENQRVAARFDFLASHLEMENNKVLPLVIPEFSIYSLFDVIYRLDWVSVFAAEELGAPLMEVPNISNLKEFLSDLEIIEEEEA